MVLTRFIKLLKLNRNIFIIFFVTIFKIIYFYYYSTFNYFTLDECYSLILSRASYLNIISELLSGNNLPLFEILLKLFNKAFNFYEIRYIRMLPFFFNLLSYFTVSAFLIRYYSFKSLAIFSTLFLFSTQLNYFASEVRCYSLFSFLSILTSIISFVHLNNGKKNSIILNILYFISSLALIFTHYFGFILFFIQCFILLIHYKKINQWVITTIFILLAISFLFIYILKGNIIKTTSSGTWITGFSAKHLYGFINIFLNSKWTTLVFIILLFLNSSSVKSWFVDFKIIRNFYLVIFLSSYLIIFFVSFIQPLFIERYVSHLFIIFYLAIAIFFHHFKPKIYTLSFISVTIVYSFYFKPFQSNNRKNFFASKQITQTNSKTSQIYFYPNYSKYEYFLYSNFENFYNLDYEKLKFELKFNSPFSLDYKYYYLLKEESKNLISELNKNTDKKFKQFDFPENNVVYLKQE